MIGILKNIQIFSLYLLSWLFPCMDFKCPVCGGCGTVDCNQCQRICSICDGFGELQ